MTNDHELSTIEGLLHRNVQPFKYSISRERDRIIHKQKYKRSEQVRSVIDNKKMSSISKLERKATEPSTRLQHIYSAVEIERHRVPEKRREPFADLSLEALINTS
jgi:hypothetical protein